MVKINFADVKEREIIPVGDYECTLTAITFVAKKATTKAPYIKCEFTVSEEGEAQGRKLFRNLSLSEESLWAFKSAMIALGTDPEEFDDEVDPEEMARDNIGNTAVLTVTHQKDTRDPSGEKMQPNVQRIRSAEEAFA